MGWKTLDDMDPGGKRVLLRVDINVPVEQGEVTDDTRMRRIAPTLDTICAAGGKAILLAHFGRPKGKRVADMSLRPLVPALEHAIGRAVMFCADNRGAAAEAAVAALPEGGVLLLENTRFEPGEERNDPDLAQDFAALGDIYCNDAFSAAHRAHASTEGVARLLPACAGRLMQAELSALDAALGHPERPVMAVVGGAKVSTKLDLLGNLLEKVDVLAIGGGMANTFLAAQGIAVGRSLCEHDMGETARDILAKAERLNTRILLPRDIVVAAELRENALSEVRDVTACPADGMILDAGPESVAALVAAMQEARTLVWNGPLGAFEFAPFDAATNAAAQEAARLSAAGKLTSVAGGGDTVAALHHAGAAEGFSYVSTAGGAFLEWMEGKELPGVAALMR